MIEMPKTSRRSNTRNRNVQKIEVNAVKPVATNKAQLATQISDYSEYAKRDLKWSAISALFVIVIMVIIYIIFR